MSYDKYYRVRCDMCGLYCIPFDDETPYGCSSYDPPEPHDPYHYCRKCYPELKKQWLKQLKDSPSNGDWHKSRAENWAAKKLGLAWSNGIGILGSKGDWADAHQYITQKEYDRLSKLPYWGYCEKCGSKNDSCHVLYGMVCSNKKCKRYRKYKQI